MQDEEVDLTGVPVLLSFVPLSAAVHLEQGATDSTRPSLSLRVRLEDEQDISTPDGRSLKDIDWSITLYQGPVSSESVRSLGAIGMLNYYPARDYEDFSVAEGCSMWAHLDAETFDLMRTVVLSGRLPQAIQIAARGIRHGWAPDGSEAVWSVKKLKDAPLDRIQVGIQLVGPQDSAERDAADASAPRDDIRGVINEVLLRPLTQLSTRMGWAVVLLAVVAAAVILR